MTMATTERTLYTWQCSLCHGEINNNDSDDDFVVLLHDTGLIIYVAQDLQKAKQENTTGDIYLEQLKQKSNDHELSLSDIARQWAHDVKNHFDPNTAIPKGYAIYHKKYCKSIHDKLLYCSRCDKPIEIESKLWLQIDNHDNDISAVIYKASPNKQLNLELLDSAKTIMHYRCHSVQERWG